MVGFEYKGKSTENIISTPLILVSSESTGSVIGSQRTKVEGDITISRPITNEYGATGEPLSFIYGLMKEDLEPYTEAEQIAVERWLSSPKLSSELKIKNCDDYQYSYFGLFTSTEWIIGNGGFMMCNFTFQVNGYHAFKYVEITKEHYNCTAARYDDNEFPNMITSIDSDFELVFNCDTDELEEYVYPRIVAKAVNIVSTNNNTSFTIQNITDNNREVTIETQRKNYVLFDCLHNIVGERKGGETEFTPLKYSDIGWTDMGNIYWPAIVAGENRWHVYGGVELSISFYIPYKKVGGWLV